MRLREVGKVVVYLRQMRWLQRSNCVAVSPGTEARCCLGFGPSPRETRVSLGWKYHGHALKVTAHYNFNLCYSIDGLELMRQRGIQLFN